MELLIIAIVAGLPLFAVLLLFTMALRLVMPGKRDRRRDEEEILWMQQMNEGFRRMDERIEALETLLLEQTPQPRERQVAGRRGR